MSLLHAFLLLSNIALDDVPHFTHLSVDAHLDYFRLLNVMNNPDMNLHV